MAAAATAVDVGGETVRDGIPPVRLRVEGMMCQNSCGTTVRNALLSVGGVERAEAIFASSSATAWGTALVASDLIDAVECVGFGATVENTSAEGRRRGSSDTHRRKTRQAKPSAVVP